MNKTFSPATVKSNPEASARPLRCNVTVEPSSIDFLDEGALLVAGTGDTTGCAILPMPMARPNGRRGPAAMNR